MRPRRPLQLILIIAVAAGSCAPPRASDAIVEQLRIAVTVQADGSLAVSESFTVRSFARAAPPFERRLRRLRTDGIVDVRASTAERIAGEPGDAQVDVDRGGDVRVVWPGGAGEAGRTLRLEYRVIGGLYVEGTRAWFSQRILPLDPASPVAAAAVDFRFPPETPVVSGPSMEGGYWDSAPGSSRVTFTRSGIQAHEEVVLNAEFDVHAVTILVPAWQQNADRAREMAPAFVTGAFFILVIGVGAVIMVRVQYPKGQAAAGVKTTLRDVAKGLMITGVVALALGGAAAAGLPWAIERYGRAVTSIPASVIVVGVVMVAAGIQLRAPRGTR